MAALLIGILVANTATAYTYLESITHEPVGDDEIKITIVITNPDSEDRSFKIYVLRGGDGKEITTKAALVASGKTATVTISSNWATWDIYSLGGSYMIQLVEEDLGLVDQTDIIHVVPPGGPVACSCGCHGVLLEAPIHEDDYSNCPELCSRKCAGFTDCKADCGNCCSDYCQNAGLPSEGVAACEDSCDDACKFNSTIYGLIDLVRYIAIAVAAVVFAVCGLKFLVSDDPESRRGAKRCFMYIIFAIILLGVAEALVGLFYEIPSTGPPTPMPTTNIYIPQIGDAVVSCWDSSTGGSDRVCAKIDVSVWVAYTVTETDVKNYLDSIGRSDVKDKMDWKIGVDITQHLGQKVCLKYDTSWGNEVLVLKESQDTLCIYFSDETKQIGDAVVSCWDSSTGGSDRVCTKINVSGWADGATVAEVNVQNYLESIGRGDVKGKIDWKIGMAIDKNLGEEVCLKYDTSWGNEVFVLKESDSDCS